MVSMEFQAKAETTKNTNRRQPHRWHVIYDGKSPSNTT